ncbi:UDP-2,4-diacetamido-2,4,6-trideoxy-beta-L-altropyranose hydrolase [Microbacterium sp. Re1]|uniref:UDP-2,4-diacetamido-2,4, 6-trideoxy-beta-L-altropyranose hydrolase n=1 Tax=Microbacterium commune TaxID=2762219 RepID=A0ABR8W1R5_9MICO|nr:bifunctional UDP-2,4-diacetamido-2,4,6-trideoxy-beta-L-altropyranose hydrolase/GNAT family N-acetyltransferase [Microbacterium commune]MBD8010980.1 UDP-2,4-diacetamido-2,4,6-trideoxy-beta-L-altropyranose hydrolase [Microbacterium commune]
MTARQVLFHCNSGGRHGMGHLMRTAAVAAVARERGWVSAVVGDIDDVGSRLLRRALGDVRLHRCDAAALADVLRSRASEGFDVVHVDSYESVPSAAAGVLLSNMQDGPFGVRRADLAIDASLGAEHHFAEPSLSRRHIAGIDGAVIREQVLHQRGRLKRSDATAHVLVVMGGTDPRSITSRVIRALDEISLALRVTVVDPRGSAAVAAAAESSRHEMKVLGFVDDLPALAAQQDLAITAAGTSMWDFACIGLPMAAVCAVQNQRDGYREMIERELALGLGDGSFAELAEKIHLVEQLLRSPEARRAVGERLMSLVDGRGAWRIVSSWEQLITQTAASTDEPVSLAARAASMEDATRLFSWRDDPATRSASRSQAPLDQEAHRSWLARTIADSDRRLLIISSGEEPVATVRWDRDGTRSGTWEVSLTIAPARRGSGLGGSVLAAAERALDAEEPRRLLATVHADNTLSLRLFQRAGYLPYLPADERGFRVFAKWRVEASDQIMSHASGVPRATSRVNVRP